MTAIEPPPFRLTELTDCGGCAAKLGADLLADALAGSGAEAAADAPGALIAGLNPPDDAAAYRVSDDLAIIGTLDFFPPLVDDPRTFGEIAAANALSDVFAMGGRVLFALSIAAFPEDLPRDVLTEIFGGASSKVREAGGTLAGGHTIRDPEPKYGLAVIGAAHPDRLLRKGGARPGDRLRADQAARDRRARVRLAPGQDDATATSAAAIDGMRRLTGRPPRRSSRPAIRGATDVTGFGLLGHGLEMARGSGTRFVFDADGAAGPAGALRARGGRRRDRWRRAQPPFRAPVARRRRGVPTSSSTIAHDPQTSGGLLAAVPADRVDDRSRRRSRRPASSAGGSEASVPANLA